MLLCQYKWGDRAGKLSGYLSKWSMADVYVMAIMIAFLGIRASADTSSLIYTEIEFESGFYYFLGFCLLSILSSQLLERETNMLMEPVLNMLIRFDLCCGCPAHRYYPPFIRVQRTEGEAKTC